MRERVIAVFDIGKTNKKLLLFDYDLKLVSEVEEKFAGIKDDDGFEYEDLDLIEKWIKKSLIKLVRSEDYDLTAVNFTAYGATLVYLDSNGKRLMPVYKYLKPIDEHILQKLFDKYGGKEEFCRSTASPSSGMLNSGLQALWLKNVRPDVFAKTRHIIHFPQYLSYLLTGKIYSEHTSIGCHTALWNFDEMRYHRWVKDECLKVPEPAATNTLEEIVIEGKKIKAGIGINDISASLVPYFSSGNEKFLLVSTGNWFFGMNPFNDEKLTVHQLSKDCLCYLSIYAKPVKSSMLSLGHFHKTALHLMSNYFKIREEGFKLIKPDAKLFSKLSIKFRNRKVFFNDGEPLRQLNEEIDLFEFDNFVEGYHQLLIELCDLTLEAIDMVIPESEDVKNLYITGSFSENSIFVKLLASSYPHMKVYTSEVKNTNALGSALVILKSLEPATKPILDLGLNECLISK
jgi:hypothetical protein